MLTVAYPFAAIGPDAVGGAEQVASAIDRALIAAGHESVVIATADSVAAGRLHPLPCPTGEIDDAARAAQHARVRAAIAAEPADIVHLHGIDFASYVPDRLTVGTLHLPPDWYPSGIWTGRAWLNPVSAAQARACPPSARLLDAVPNGVDVAALSGTRRRCGALSGTRRRCGALSGTRRRCGYALTLGRICPEKGQHLALQAAHAAGVPLLIAGFAFPYAAHQAYLRDVVTPLLDRRRRLIGPVDVARKRTLLSGARCLLIPSTAAETSSLVAMEAAACGCPVVAYRSGALPETVRDGVTGFIVDDVAGMAAAIGRVDAVDPDACRAEAAVRFDARRMTADYLALYGQLLAGRAE